MKSSGFHSILIVDDEKNTRDGLKRFLESKDYDVSIAENGLQALELVKAEKPDMALIDLRMPEMDGMSLLHRLHQESRDTVVIMLTAYGTVESAVQAMKAGAYYYLTKPVNLDELELILKKAVREKKLETENVSLRQDLIQEKYEAGKIVGMSKVIQDLIQMAERVAESSATVLLQGESGTGKELFAHMIHRMSRRKNEPFVAVHCAALTESLLTSELFGHEKGSFTGATERKIGRFERADKGTLFLDEIGEISPDTQVKLLRFLQEGEFERVGNSRSMRVDVRLICATNKDLQKEVREGRFREDLYYRINVILLQVPPLRERREDIPLLISHYLTHFTKLNGKKIKNISKNTMEFLVQYDWPGNIRELRNVVERMVVLAKTELLAEDSLPEDIRHYSDNARKIGLFRSRMDADANLAEVERITINHALKSLGGNKSLAAKKLGISRRTLYRKLDEFNQTQKSES